MRKIRLTELFADYPTLTPVPEVEVSGVKLDSRQVQPGDLFVALEGGKRDGHEFIAEAVKRGAAAVVGTRTGGGEAPYVRVADSRGALAKLAAGLFGYPARKLTMILFSASCRSD